MNIHTSHLQHRVSFVFLAVVALGCGAEQASVNGAVVDASGTPVPNIRLVASQQSDATWASATTGADGSFTLMSGKQGGVPPGDYTVVLTEEGGDWERQGPRKVPRRYNSAATSDITFHAEAGENVVLDIKLERK